jgi:7-cyano-7-deazaguanine synthase
MAQTDVSTLSTHSTDRSAAAVLVSGGLDSAILLAESARDDAEVYPLFIRSGLLWERAELSHLRQFLEAIQTSSLQQLVILETPVVDLYGDHWSITGRGVPDAQTSDAAVYLPGRNVLLLTKAILWCHLNSVDELRLGILESNPFFDATPAFFSSFETFLNTSVNGRVRIVRPFAAMSKRDVLKRGSRLPLQWTFSCIRPMSGKHCGECNKCAERRRAFIDAEISDPTVYVSENPCIV